VRRVLLLSPTATAGGSERAVVNLARALPEHGYEPAAVLLENGPLEEWLGEAGCPLTVVPTTRTRYVHHTARTLARLRRLVLLEGAAAVVSSTSKGHVFGGTAARTAGVPSIWWNHGIPELNAIERAAARVPTAAVVCGTEQAVEAQRLITPTRPIWKIHPGTDVAAVAARTGFGERIRHELGWEEHCLVGIVGRLQPWKGQETFLRAASLVARSHPDARFLVVGGAILGCEGSYPDDLQQLADELGISERVHFAGHRPDVWDWCDALDVVVHASFGEPFGLVVVEAMALGKPLIAAADGGPLEIVADGVSGLLTRPGDDEELALAVARLMDDSELAADLGAQAKLRANEFSLERTGDQFAALLDEVLGPRRRNGGSRSNDHRPRVALVAHRIEGHSGMDRALAELLKRGSDDFKFVVFATTLAEELRPLVEWRRVPVPRRPFTASFVSFFVLAGVRLACERFDLVCTAGAIVPNRADVATVHHCHAGFRRATGRLAPADAPLIRRVNTGFLRAMSLAAERWSYRDDRTRMLTAVSRGLESELAHSFPGVPVTVVPNGVDLDRFRPLHGPRRTELRDDLQLGEYDVVALFVGGDWPLKGLGAAIRGLGRARASGARQLRLWVVGKGDVRRFSSLARQCGVAGAVTFFGPRADTERFYGAADIFVFPTEYEAFPLVVLEALAAGLPVVATRANGVAEFFDGRRPGILVERTPESVGEALGRLAQDARLREHMGRDGRALAARYTWERSVHAMLDVYRQLLDTNGSGAGSQAGSVHSRNTGLIDRAARR
jgi:glycosyltransferase involved in cell wall biosynthesis